MGVSGRDITGTMPPAAGAALRTSFSKLFDEIGTVDQVGARVQGFEPGQYTLKIKIVDKRRNQTLTPSATFTVT